MEQEEASARKEGSQVQLTVRVRAKVGVAVGAGLVQGPLSQVRLGVGGLG